MKASRRWRFFSMLSAGTGLGIIAGELISAEDNDGFNIGITGIGAGVFLLAVSLSIKADRKADKAIDLYNACQAMMGSGYRKAQLVLAVDSNGIGLKLKF